MTEQEAKQNKELKVMLSGYVSDILNGTDMVKTTSALASKLVKMLAVNDDLLIAIKEFKHYFECNWDWDPDLLSADQERDHYRWCIKKLSDLGEQSYPNYIQKIDEKETQDVN